MKVLFLFGNTAVGKMTVGQELTKITDFRLFYNHMTIEPVIDLFGSYQPKVIERLREVIFEEFAATDCYGLIFTFMWAFNLQSDWDYIAHVKEIFQQRNADVTFYYVELVASQEVRLQRNVTENRLACKPSKRDVEQSNQRLLHADATYRCESFDGEIPFDHYVKIENSSLSPDVVAEKIKELFHF